MIRPSTRARVSPTSMRDLGADGICPAAESGQTMGETPANVTRRRPRRSSMIAPERKLGSGRYRGPGTRSDKQRSEQQPRRPRRLRRPRLPRQWPVVATSATAVAVVVGGGAVSAQSRGRRNRRRRLAGSDRRGGRYLALAGSSSRLRHRSSRQRNSQAERLSAPTPVPTAAPTTVVVNHCGPFHDPDDDHRIASRDRCAVVARHLPRGVHGDERQ